VLEAATQEGGLGFTKASAKLRLVSAQWKTVRDAMVKRLVVKRKATDKGMGVLVPGGGLAGVQVGTRRARSDGRGAVRSEQPDFAH
jgi:hypothetical protein